MFMIPIPLGCKLMARRRIITQGIIKTGENTVRCVGHLPISHRRFFFSSHALPVGDYRDSGTKVSRKSGCSDRFIELRSILFLISFITVTPTEFIVFLIDIAIETDGFVETTSRFCLLSCRKNNFFTYFLQLLLSMKHSATHLSKLRQGRYITISLYNTVSYPYIIHEHIRNLASMPFKSAQLWNISYIYRSLSLESSHYSSCIHKIGGELVWMRF